MTDEPIEITVDQAAASSGETVTGAIRGAEGLVRVHLARIAMHLPGAGRERQQITELREGVKNPSEQISPDPPDGDGWRRFRLQIPPDALPSVSTPGAVIEWRVWARDSTGRESPRRVVDVPTPGEIAEADRSIETAVRAPKVIGDPWERESRWCTVTADPVVAGRGQPIRVRAEGVSRRRMLGLRGPKESPVASLALQCEEIAGTNTASGVTTRRVVKEIVAPASLGDEVTLLVPDDAPYTLDSIGLTWRWRAIARDSVGQVLGVARIVVRAGRDDRGYPSTSAYLSTLAELRRTASASRLRTPSATSEIQLDSEVVTPGQELTGWVRYGDEAPLEEQARGESELPRHETEDPKGAWLALHCRDVALPPTELLEPVTQDNRVGLLRWADLRNGGRTTPEAAREDGWRRFRIRLPHDIGTSVETTRAAVAWSITCVGAPDRDVVIAPRIVSEDNSIETSIPESRRPEWDEVSRGASISIEPGLVARNGRVRAQPTGAGIVELALQCEEERDVTPYDPDEGDMRYESAFEPRFDTWLVVDARTPASAGEVVELRIPSDAPYSLEGSVVSWRWRVAALDAEGNALAAAPLRVAPAQVADATPEPR